MREFDLEPGEHVVKEARKHWFIFLMTLVPYAVLTVLPFALPNLLRLVGPLAPLAAYLTPKEPLVRVALSIWLLAVWTGAFSAVTRYYLNLWVLTDRRIVDIKQRSYFNREVSSLMLNRVQDVTSDVSGALASFLDIGEIRVQSAGAQDEFVMHGIPRPMQMRDIILKYVAEKADPNPSV